MFGQGGGGAGNAGRGGGGLISGQRKAKQRGEGGVRGVVAGKEGGRGAKLLGGRPNGHTTCLEGTESG